MGRHSSEQAGLRGKGNKSSGKIFLRKGKKFTLTAALSQMDWPVRKCLCKPTGSAWQCLVSAAQVRSQVRKESSSAVLLCHFPFALPCCLCEAEFPQHSRQTGARCNSSIRLVKVSLIIVSKFVCSDLGAVMWWRSLGETWDEQNFQDQVCFHSGATYESSEKKEILVEEFGVEQPAEGSLFFFW